MCGVRERPRSKKGEINIDDEEAQGPLKHIEGGSERRKSAMEVVKIRILNSQDIRKMA